MAKIDDVVPGSRYGSAEVVEVFRGEAPYLDWARCRCECGRDRDILLSQLGRTGKCYCERGPEKKHGLSKHRLYFIHHGMMRRCYDQDHQAYHNYGGRGIRVCDEWANDVAAFFAWAMGSGYQEGLTIDRRDTNGDYEPNNCHWISKERQGSNRRNNFRVTAWGETKTIADWTRDPRVAKGLRSDTLIHRIKKAKWPIEKALTTPVRMVT